MSKELELKLVPDQTRQVKLIKELERNSGQELATRVAGILELMDFEVAYVDNELITDIYFDTDGASLANSQRLVRLRTVKSKCSFMIKTPISRSADGVFDRTEHSLELQQSWRPQEQPAVAKLIRQYLPDISEKDLKQRLEVRNMRRSFSAGRGDAHLDIFIDVYEYHIAHLNKRTKKELEIEMEARDEGGRLMLQLRKDSFKRALGSDELQPATKSKYERGLERLSALDERGRFKKEGGVKERLHRKLYERGEFWIGVIALLLGIWAYFFPLPPNWFQ